MSTYILTSLFPDGFHADVAAIMKRLITKRNKFAFIASEFAKEHEKTDGYFASVVGMFEKIGIFFDEAYVVDGRLTKEAAQHAVKEADVLWLSGGDTIAELQYLRQYDLVRTIRDHPGVVIGMSAGAINLAKTAVCYGFDCGCDRREIYEGIGCVDISVDPHFDAQQVLGDLLEASSQHVIYGLCDDAMIVCEGGKTAFIGEVYRLKDGTVTKI